MRGKKRAFLDNEQAWIASKRPRLNPAQKSAVQREVKRELRKTTDLKWTNVSESPNVDYSGYQRSLLYNISKGDSPHNNYDGSEIFPKSVTVRYGVRGYDNTYNNIRVIILQVIKGAAPAAADLLQSTGNVRTPFSSYDRSWKTNVKILSDKLFHCQSAVGALYGNQTEVIYIKGIRLRPITINQVDTTQTITSGDIRIYVYTDSVDANPMIDYYSEVAYSD